ncbi:hypothetical protein ACFLVV_03575 [Chloroflexota bacterium]
MNRVFTQEELEEMGKRTVDLLTEAIEAGDKERAKKLAGRMYREFSSMHDLYVDWTAGFMDYIYASYGEDALYQALRKVIAYLGHMVDVRNVDFRRRVQGLSSVLQGHLEAMKVEEDDDKVCITMEPCGSGQRLVQKGAYEAPRNLTRIQKLHAMTWGMNDFPVYCTHCPVLEILSIEQLGYLANVTFTSQKVAEGPCKLCTYKNVEDIPEEVYTRVGKQKPKGG